jgi:hypothetical protein
MTEKIEWMKRLSVALEAAREEGRHLLVDFESPR